MFFSKLMRLARSLTIVAPIILGSVIFTFQPVLAFAEPMNGKKFLEKLKEQVTGEKNEKDESSTDVAKKSRKTDKSIKDNNSDSEAETELDTIAKLPKSISFDRKFLDSISPKIKKLSDAEFEKLPSKPKARPIAYIEVDGTINPGSASFIETSILHAQENDYQALIIRLDTPGGLLSSTRDIIRFFSDSTVPVVIFVHPGGARATSAGAILSIAAHVVAMSPGSNIGAAAPVTSGGNLEGDLAKKAKNDTAAMVRAQAELRGRNHKLAELIVRESVSLSAKEATTQRLTDFVSSDLRELLQQLNHLEIPLGEGKTSIVLETSELTIENLVTMKMNASQKFLHLVANPNISTMLMAIGGMALYAEISSGFSLMLPGVFGAICLVLAFVSLQTLPINIGGLILFSLGLILIMAEGFVSSFGLLSVGGIISLGIGALFLVDVTKSDIQVSLSLIGPMLAAFALVMGTVSFIMARDRRAPKTNFDPLLGKIATIREVESCHTKGMAFVQGELWQFQSTTQFNIGDHAIVAAKDGMKVHLKPLA